MKTSDSTHTVGVQGDHVQITIAQRCYQFVTRYERGSGSIQNKIDIFLLSQWEVGQRFGDGIERNTERWHALVEVDERVDSHDKHAADRTRHCNHFLTVVRQGVKRPNDWMHVLPDIQRNSHLDRQGIGLIRVGG